jgi:hypothetical protein
VPQPGPEATSPSPENPDSVAIANRLTSELSKGRAIPADVRVEGDGFTPLEFRISQGSFKAEAVLRKNGVTASLTFDVYWDPQLPASASCPSVISHGSFCTFSSLKDGSTIVYVTVAGDSPELTAQESAMVARPDGTKIIVDLTDSTPGSRARTKGLPLTTEQMAAMAGIKGFTLG